MISEKDIIDSLAPIKTRGIQNELNHVKMVFSYAYPNDRQVEVQYSKLIPSIWIVSKDKKSSKRLCTPATDFLFSKKQVRHLDIIDKIYGKLYLRIGPQYQQLIQFGLEKAVDLRKDRLFTWQSVMNVKKAKKRLMFYCCYTYGEKQDIFGFTLFDRNLMIMEFDSMYVKKLKNYLREQYSLYLEMIDHYYPVQDQTPSTKKVATKPKEAPHSNFLEQAAQKKPSQVLLIKQQQNLSWNRPSIPQNSGQNEIRLKLSQLLKKDLKKYQKQLKALDEDKRQMQLRYRQGGYVQKYQLQNIKQQYIQLNEKLSYFKKTVKQIEASIARNHKNFNSFYKRILMASKHLESKLPIIAKKTLIMESLVQFQLIILEAETGSGKSTQLPQILCEYFDLFNEEEVNHLPVLITQPRKLAVRALAQRVADQLQEKVGQFVDYVDSDSRIESKRAKIVFKLDRIVLDEMILDPALSNYSCLVLDEAHERTINIDVIIGILNNLFKKARKNFKVIITSASMDIKLFQNYFKTHFSHIRLSSIKISGRQHNVTLTYFDYNFLKSSTEKIERAISEILVDNYEMKEKFCGNVLIFCTSVEQIGFLVQKYIKRLSSKVFKVLALHGKLTTEEQNLVFQKSKQFKMIFCTRIAETAITIDGVKVVIDPGLDYQKIFDQKSKISSMKLKQISQSAAKQRAGRAGRTNQGFCFRLYSQNHLSKRPPNQIPQIENQSLEIVILRLKLLNVQNAAKFNYLSPPSIPALEASQQLLKMIGALDENNRINSIGRLLVKIPIQPFLSRAIAESLIYQSIIQQDNEVLKYFRIAQYNQVKQYPISKSVVEILCMVNADRLFNSNEDPQRGDQIKFQKFSDQSGDFFYLRNIYHKFIELRKKYGKNHYQIKQKLSENLLNYKSLCEIENNQKEISMILQKQGKIKLNLIGPSVKSACRKKIENSTSYEDLILSCLLSSFGTNLALYSQHPQFGYTLLKNKIPIKIYGTSTLSLQGIFPKWIIGYNLYENQRGQIYCKVAHGVKDQYFENEYLQEYLCDKLEVNKFIGGNPFFTRKQYDTSTYIYNYVQYIYLQRRQLISYNWLSQNIEILFNDSNSNFSLFVCSQNDSITQQQLAHFDNFLAALNKNMEEVERFNYLGNRIILFDKQFQIFNIEFDIVEHIIQISKMSPVIFNLVLNHCYGFGKLEPIDYRTIRIYLDQPSFSSHVKNQLQNYRNYGSFHVKQLNITRNYSQPNVQMILYFFAGQRSDSINHNGVILTGYNHDTMKNNLSYLREVINKQWRNKTEISQYITSIISIEYSNIKIQTTLDEIEIGNYIDQLINQSKLDPSFNRPFQCLRYRKPYIPYNTYTDDLWIQQIRNKLGRYADISNCIISISQFNEGQYADHQRINLRAIVTLQNSKAAEELSARIDGRDHVIGCDKIHTQLRYTMNVCTIPIVIYNFYQAEVDYIYMQEKSNGNNFEMHYRSVNSYKNQIYVEMLEIKISSNNKKMLFGPSKAIKRIFIPKIIKLTKIQAQGFKNHTDQILYEIRQKTKGELIFQYKSKSIKIYCDEQEVKKIQKQIKDILKTKEVKLSSVSYKGKNLNKVLEITKKFESKHRQTEFSSQINFRNKTIQLSGNVQVIQQCKYEINQINQKINPQCIICQNIIRTNFTLHNCRHSFCWECIANFCREEKLNEQQREIEFKCPYQSNDKRCSANIFIQDINMLFSQQEFRDICEAKIRSYVKKNYEEYCMCSNCGQIFKENISNRIPDCSFCGSEIILYGQN